MANMKAFIKDAPFGVSVIFIILAIGFVYIAAPVFGNSALIVRSGSMQPSVAVGDLVLTRAQKNLPYKAGDIISFKSQDKIISHRILGQKNQNGKIYYQTKGDANKNEDPNLVAESEILGKAYFRLPYLGKLIAFTKTSAGFSLAVIFPALLVIVFEIQNIFKEINKQKAVRPEVAKQPEYPIVTPMIEVVNFSGFSNRHKLGFRLPSLKILLPILAGTLLVYSSFAYFSDTETSTGNVFTAADSFGSPVADHIVISEVQIRGSTPNPTEKDFIELYNPTDSSIDLSGWKLRKKNANGTEDSIRVIESEKSIPAHGFFLWATSDESYNVTLNADTTSAENLSENNSVALLKSDNSMVDQIAWGSTINPQFVEGTAFPANMSGNESIERKAYSTSTVTSMTTGTDTDKGNGFDSNDNATDFILRSVSQPQNSGSATESP